MSFFKKRLEEVETPTIHEDCIPQIIPSRIDQETERQLFYMFYRIKEAKMDDALIHIEPSLTKWWDDLWKRYDDAVRRSKLLDRLNGVLENEFTSQELEDLSQLDKFKIKAHEKSPHDLGETPF